MTQIEKVFILEQIPKGTSQMKRVNHRNGTFFEGKDLKEARRIYTNCLSQCAPEHPIEGPVMVRMNFGYFIKDKKKKGKPKTSRPDCDNLVKLVLDCMTSLGYWNDDSQIVSLTVGKMFSTGAAFFSVAVKEVCDD